MSRTEKQTEDEAVGAKEELQQFLDRLVHDMRAPLRSMTAFAELLKQDFSDTACTDRDRFLDEVLGGAARMRELLDSVASYSVALDGNHTRSGSSLEVALLAAQANLETPIRKLRAKVTSDPLPQVDLRLERSIQLLQNLLHNSLKFHSDEPPLIHIWARQEDSDRWLIGVRDNGIGINPRDFQAIFWPFTCIQRNEHTGVGLGLYICRKIVALHGGRMWVESALSQGSTFCFTLPAAS